MLSPRTTPQPTSQDVLNKMNSMVLKKKNQVNLALGFFLGFRPSQSVLTHYPTKVHGPCFSSLQNRAFGSPLPPHEILSNLKNLSMKRIFSVNLIQPCSKKVMEVRRPDPREVATKTGTYESRRRIRTQNVRATSGTKVHRYACDLQQ